MPQPNRYTKGGSAAYTAEEIDDALTALIAYAGNESAARRYLQEQGLRCPGVGTIASWSRTTYWERYEELCETVAAGREKALEHRFLDATHAATETMMLAVRVAHERLEQGSDPDPARSAAYLSKVAQVSTDKRMTLQGRPTQIVENRDIGAIIRSLEAKGIVEVPKQIEGTMDGHDER